MIRDFEGDVFCISAAFGKVFALCVGGRWLAALCGGADADLRLQIIVKSA